MSFFKPQKIPPKVTLPTHYDSLDGYGKLEVREQYVIEQKGYCYHCKGSLNSPAPEDMKEKIITPNLFPSGFFVKPIHLHHSHDTGLTIGAVHAWCNAVLWEHYGE